MVDEKNKGVKDQVAKRDLKSELKKLNQTEAKWSREPTAFDHLPPYERPFNVQPFADERERLPFKMTDEDRKRRQKWIESQALTDREPVYVPEIEKEIYNPIRRLYRAPFNALFNSLEPVIGVEKARYFRWFTPKFLFCYVAVLGGYYHLKYYQRTWEGKYGWSVYFANKAVPKGQPVPKEKEPEDYQDGGFKARKAFRGPGYAY